MCGDEEGVGLVIVVVVGDVLDDVLHVEVHPHHPHQLQPLRLRHRWVETRLADAESQACANRQKHDNLQTVAITELHCYTFDGKGRLTWPGETSRNMITFKQ